MSLVTILDVKKLCRICLRCELNMRFIYDTHQNPTVAQMLGELTYRVQSSGELPNLICSDCLELVLSAYKLKEQFEHSNKILYNMLDNEHTDANIIEEINVAEKSTQTEASFVNSFRNSVEDFSSSCDLEILEDQNKSPKNRKSYTDEVNSLFNQLNKSNRSKLSDEDSLSERELLKFLDDNNIQYSPDDDNEEELALSMLIESSDTSQIIEVDTNSQTSDEIDNFIESEDIVDRKFYSNKRRKENYKLKSKYNTRGDKNKFPETKNIAAQASKYCKNNKKSTHRDKLFNCSKCSKKFSTKDSLQRHMEIHDKKRFVCRECYKPFLTKEELISHGKAEGHDKPLLCPECGLRCKSSDILTVHIRRHNGEKPFKCKFCTKGFPRMGDLKIHEKYHTGEKSHFCDICGKGFFRKYNLGIHIRVHTGEKPYKCSHCPQAFAQSNDLKTHIRRHTGERFRCEICNASFLQGYQIRQHKFQEHGIHESPPTQRVQKFMLIEEKKQI